MLEQLCRGLETGDPATVVSTFADDITLRVAVHDDPFDGKAVAAGILEAVLDGVLTGFAVTDTIADATGTVVLFDVDVVNYPRRAQGLLVVRTAGSGHVNELTVFLRPLAALQEVSDEMGRRLGGL